MEKSVMPARMFYGWYIVGACFLIMGIMAGSGATFPVFFEPLLNEFRWSRTALSGTVSIGFIVGGIVTPFWGAWTDRSGARLVVVVAAIFGGLSLLFRAGIGTLWHLYLLSALGSLFFAGVSLIPLSTVVSQWFQSRRGVAMGTILVGAGIGSLIAPVVANYVIMAVGWRNSYLLLGGFIWITVIPIAGLLLRRRPQDMGLLPDGEVAQSKRGDNGEEDHNPVLVVPVKQPSPVDVTLKEAAGTLAFWMIAVAFFLPMMSGVGLLTHLVIMFKGMGMSSHKASACLGCIGGLSIVGRFSFGFMADRFSVRKVYTACYIIEAFGVSMLLLTPLFDMRALYAYVLIYGLATGGGLVLAPLMIGDCFGTRALGAIFGILALAAVAGGALGPLLAGFIYDSTKSYYIAFVIFSAGEFVAALAISQARTPVTHR
jgi:MFS family permease